MSARGHGGRESEREFAWDDLVLAWCWVGLCGLALIYSRILLVVVFVLTVVHMWGMFQRASARREAVRRAALRRHAQGVGRGRRPVVSPQRGERRA